MSKRVFGETVVGNYKLPVYNGKRRRYGKVVPKKTGRMGRRRAAGFLSTQVIPFERTTRHAYVTHYQLNSAIAPAYNTFRANGLWDPDQSGVGHKPLYYDEMSHLYQRYEVLSSKMSCCFSFQSTTGAAHVCMVGIAVDADASCATSTMQNFMERGWPMVSYKMMGMNQSNSQCIKWVNQSFSARKFFRHPKGDSDLSSDVNGLPNEQAYYHVFVGPPNGSTDLASIEVTVKIEYLVRWSRPEEIISS